MGISVRLVISLFLLVLIYGCDNNNNDIDSAQDENVIKVSLRPLSPFQYEFTNEDGKIHIKYFFTKRENWKNKQFRDEIRQQVNFIYSQIAEHDKYALISIYIYAHSERLNEQFKSTKSILGTEYGDELISYTRWHKSKQDTFYFIESGNVVFDMLSGTIESSPWDFD